MKSQQVSEKPFIGQDVPMLVVSIYQPCAEIQNSGKLPNFSGALQQADSMKLVSMLCADIETRASRNTPRTWQILSCKYEYRQRNVLPTSAREGMARW